MSNPHSDCTEKFEYEIDENRWIELVPGGEGIFRLKNAEQFDFELDKGKDLIRITR